MGVLTNAIRAIASAAGYDIRRRDAWSTPGAQIARVLTDRNVDLVLDVGANVGQFARSLRSAGYHGEIISFEPLSTAHATLLSAADRDPKWRVYPRGAIGDRDGEVEINVAGNSVSSSVLPMLEAHYAAASNSAYVGREWTAMYTLDTVVPLCGGYDRRTFLKIDAQGFEWQILDGARRMLSDVVGVYCELSLVPLYRGNHLWREVIDRLEGEGFTLWSIARGFTDPRNGRTLQVDALFLRAAELSD